MTRTLLSAVAALALVAGCASTQPGSGADGQAGAPVQAPVKAPVQARDSYFVKAAAAVKSRQAERGVPRAKNVILFVGDGMGVSTITAARIYAGQAKGVDGESFRLTMEQMPWSAFSKTYTHDSQIADSAPTATAMTTGVKSWNGTIGVTQAARISDCKTGQTAGTDTLWELAKRRGLGIGVLSTTRITHATPAATFAQTTERDWEDDSFIPTSAKEAGCKDIAAQFVDWNKDVAFDVAFGGGRAQFLPKTKADPEYPGKTGARVDGRDLIAEWSAGGADRRFIHDAAGFKAHNFNSDARVLGLFEPSHMQYELDRAGDKAGEPSIREMTEAAITRLKRNPKGYVLMVEGGRIDHAHHEGKAAKALADTAALDEAVAAAIAMTDPRDTLIIVTADHSHTLTIAGYAARNNPILGLSASEIGAAVRAGDGKPYTTLGYANGPGAVCGKAEGCTRPDLTGVDTADKNFRQQALVPFGSETHGGEDVAIFAQGPGANLFSGTVEQNEIFHVMANALGLLK